MILLASGLRFLQPREWDCHSALAFPLKSPSHTSFLCNLSHYSSLHLNAKMKILAHLLIEALFAYDCTLLAHGNADLQLILSRFAKEAKLFGLTISLSKTEVFCQVFSGTNATTTVYTAESCEQLQVLG